MKLVTLRLLPRAEINKFLWDMLVNRDPMVNISHKAMPTWEQHCEFVDHHPYRDWCIIISEIGEWAGQIYLTHQNEIGVHIRLDCQRAGFGSEAVRRMIKNYGPGRYLANVAIDNPVSAVFFRKNGFKLISQTFELEVKNGTDSK